MSEAKIQPKLMVIAILLILFAIVKVAMLLWWKNQQPEIMVVSQNICDVRQGCVLPNGAKIVFSQSFSAKSPFDIDIDNVPAGIKEVFISFSMKDMDMGFNRYKLIPQSQRHWQAKQIRLPICVQNRHNYLADIHIDQQTYQIGFSTE